MEVYADQEYCGTSRGENTDFLKISENESVSLYKTRLSLERPAASCEVKNPAALGGFLQDVLGTSELAGLGSRPTSLGLAEQSINGPFSKTTGLSDSVIQSSNHHDSEFQLNTKNLPFVKDLKSLEQNAIFSGTDLKTKVSSVLDGHLKEQQILCSAEMLPFLRNICSQVRQLRVGDKPNTCRQNGLSEDESFTDFRKEPQLCAYVEKIISKHLAQMEQRLTDYIDQRIGRLQEHLDATVLSVVNLLQSCPVETVKENDFSKLITNGEV
ncbi:ATPase PAAT isoform X2 [Protopterus annectens]|nr:ATPase PAAT isoform X2 [Protopterus annectens]XP_043911971.1 ATPase PAAT isoform X2 [Protopterus annectens]